MSAMERIGFFAGSFDPPTHGHLALVRRALHVVDRLCVGVGRNADKRGWIPVDSRIELLRSMVPERVDVMAFEGLAVEAARAAGATLLVRGLRNAADLDAEMPMALANESLAPGMETIMLVAAPGVSHVSSRLVREIHRSGGDVSAFVPADVVSFLADHPPQ